MALRDVNLVPESILQRRYLLRHGVGWALAYGLLVAVLLGAYLAYTQATVAKHRVPGSEKEVRQRLADTIAEIEGKKDELDRLALVRHVSRPFGTAEILGRLAEIMDPMTWLTEISVETDAAAPPDLSCKAWRLPMHAWGPRYAHSQTTNTSKM